MNLFNKNDRFFCFEEEMHFTLCHQSRQQISQRLRHLGWFDSEINEILRLQEVALSAASPAVFTDLCFDQIELIRTNLPQYAHSLQSFEDTQESQFNRLAQVVKGKRIALVGPAAGLYHGRETGTEIDDFDLVVRLNSGWPVKKTVSHLAGKRTDILVHCCNGDLPIDFTLLTAHCELKFFCYQFGIDAPVLTRFMQSKSVPEINISSLYGTLGRSLGTAPNTGTVAIDLLLKTPLESLHLFGISAMTEPYEPTYRGHGAIEWKEPKQMRVGPHSVYPQIKFLRDAALSDARLAYDDCFAKVMQHGH